MFNGYRTVKVSLYREYTKLHNTKDKVSFVSIHTKIIKYQLH